MLMYVILAFKFFVVIVSAVKQHEYKIDIEKLEILSYNTDIIEDLQIKVSNVNEITQGISASGNLKRDLGMDIKVNMEALRMGADGEYKRMTTASDLNMCEMLNKNQFGLKDLLKYGNFTVCPWKQAYYVVNNAVLDPSKLPQMTPAGKYIMDTKFFAGTVELVHGKFTGSIEIKL